MRHAGHLFLALGLRLFIRDCNANQIVAHRNSTDADSGSGHRAWRLEVRPRKSSGGSSRSRGNSGSCRKRGAGCCFRRSSYRRSKRGAIEVVRENVVVGTTARDAIGTAMDAAEFADALDNALDIADAAKKANKVRKAIKVIR